MGCSASKDKAKPPQKQSTYRQGGFIQGGVGVGGYILNICNNVYHGNPINQQPAYQTGKAPNYNIAQNHNSYQTNKVVNVASINPNVHAGIKPVENKDFNRKQSLNDELFPQVPITTPAVPSSWLTQPYSYRGETSNSSDSNTSSESGQDASYDESDQDASMDESEENIPSDSMDEHSRPDSNSD